MYNPPPPIVAPFNPGECDLNKMKYSLLGDASTQIQAYLF